MSFEVIEGGLRIDRDPLKHINILRSSVLRHSQIYA